MLKYILSFYFLYIFINNSHAQAPLIQWQKCYGGSSYDFPYSLALTSDGGYVIAGYTYSDDGEVSGNHGGIDCWIIKLDSLGGLQWQKCLGGSESDIANSIQQTKDGGYIFAGATNSNDSNVNGNHSLPTYSDFWIVKLSSGGSLQWQQCYGGSYEEEANSIKQTSDGGYIVAGTTESNDGDVVGLHGTANGSPDYWVIKIDSIGGLQWQKCLGGIFQDEAFSVEQISDTGYVIAGNTITSLQNGDVNCSAHSGFSMWLVKLDHSGNLQWQQCLGDSSGQSITSMQLTNDGGFISAGSAYCSSYYFDYWIAKTNSLGNLQKQKWYGSEANEESSSIAYSVIQTNGGGYAVSGQTNATNGNVTANHGSIDYWIIKLDTALNLQWQECLGGSAEDAQPIIKQTHDGGFIVAGVTQSNDGEVSGNHGSQDFWVVKLRPEGLAVKENSSVENIFSVYPNPFVNGDEITFNYNVSSIQGILDIYDIEGQVIGHYILPQWSSVQHLKLPNISSGLYLARLTQGTSVANLKFLKE